jgi:hypothetical protein
MPKIRSFRVAIGVAVLAVCMAIALVGVLRQRAGAPAPAAVASVDHGVAHAALGAVNRQFAVAVTQLQRNASPPGAPAPTSDMHYVTVAVSFTNQSAQQQRADPGDFQLVDALGVARAPTFLPAPSAQCRRWQMADLYPNGAGSAPPRDQEATQAGRSFGPQQLCFTAGGATDAPLTLVWDPDVSFLFDSPTRIPLQ